ncbi:MAG: HD-GYP domain-containing protein [Epsilonproteobacteria bacterium]|nr:MAG: HD-GYP domain-containing protein [Campylobacterota bacterium]RLA67897.1 MAG: HD-GYP domain-containing protein [Campylobacterota bacterium]
MGKSDSNNIISLTELTLIKQSEEIRSLKEEHRKTCEMACRTILQALDAKDHYTYNHSTRVAWYSLNLGREMGFKESELYDLEMAGLFHDVGKIGTPDFILNKPTRLNEDEFLIMKEHPVKSAEILAGFKDFKTVAKISKHHHERFDGRGYPDGLKSDEIPLFSRIILISDTFDAMTSSRPYRQGLPYQVAFDELQEFSGSQFDPELVKLFIKAMAKEEKKNESTFFLKIIDKNFNKKAS